MPVEYLIGQRALSRARHTSDTGHDTKRYLHINIFQVILPGSSYRDISAWLAPLLWHRYLYFTAQICSCE